MILCLHDNDPFIVSFSKYLSRQGKFNICLCLDEMVSKLGVYELQNPNGKENQAYWTLHDQHLRINWSEPIYVYHQIGLLSSRHFPFENSRDVHYLVESWRAYCHYRFKKAISCINPITMSSILSGNIDPYALHRWKQNQRQGSNMTIIFSIQKTKKINKKIILKQKNMFNYAGLPSTKHCIVVQVIGLTLLATYHHNGLIKAINIDRNTSDLCINLSIDMYTPVLQLFFFSRDGLSYDLQYATAYPRWQLNAAKTAQMHRLLYSLILTPQQKKQSIDKNKSTEIKCFINKQNRPKL
jgi:hypothetical protein